jgi:hypothetical protein
LTSGVDIEERRSRTNATKNRTDSGVAGRSMIAVVLTASALQREG